MFSRHTKIKILLSGGTEVVVFFVIGILIGRNTSLFAQTDVYVVKKFLSKVIKIEIYPYWKK